MLNDSFEPTGGEEDVLSHLKAERKARPVDIYNDLDVGETSAQHWIGRLTAAGWITKPKRGIYEYTQDPRELSDEELAVLFVDYAVRELDEDVLEKFVADAE